MSSKLEHFYIILQDLERKYMEKIQIRDLIVAEIDEINNEVEHLKLFIQEKEKEEKEREEREKRERYEIEMAAYNKSADVKVYYMESAMAAAPSVFNPSAIKARIIPVKNDGEPIQELGNGKWARNK
jgi:hypothetical protein